MKIYIILLLLIPLLSFGQTQPSKGKIVTERITSASLKNSGGENATRRVTIYLPPNYEQTTNRYPVVYFLHGFTWSDSLQMAVDHFDELLDKAINTGKIRPVIVVMPDEYTLYRGSFYSNSTLTGNWADFTAKDLTEFIDRHFRTIPLKESRGLTGHSMGGFGAIKLGMLFPDVYSSVYAMSPGMLALTKEFGYSSVAYKRAAQIQSRQDLVTGYSEIDANLVVALGRTFSPNPNKPPFYADLPFAYEGGALTTNKSVLELWNDNMPLQMIDTYAANLKRLRAIKLDWARNDDFPHIPLTCKQFSQKLEDLGINHYAEEYIGTHSDKLWTDDGRALNDMLPFFNTYLTFEELKYKTPKSGKNPK